MTNGISRRSLLKGTAALTASAATIGFSGLFAGFSQAFAQAADGGDDPQTILNLAATAEAFACTHYYNALNLGKISFNAQQINQLKAALDSEVKHLQFLEANGAKPLVDKFYAPFKVWEDIATFVTVTEQAEAIFVGAYLAAVRRITELGNPLMAATLAQVVGVESEHLALIREMGGKVGNNVSLMPAVFFNVSDAVPSLTSFLKGGPGFDGPVDFPGIATINDLVGNNGVTEVNPPYTDPNVLNPAATESATMGATMDANMQATADATTQP